MTISIIAYLTICENIGWRYINNQVWYQGGVKATVSGVVEDLKFKISEDYNQNWCSGKHQFWSEPSETLNLRSSTTPETVAFTPP